MQGDSVTLQMNLITDRMQIQTVQSPYLSNGGNQPDT